MFSLGFALILLSNFSGISDFHCWQLSHCCLPFPKVKVINKSDNDLVLDLLWAWLGSMAVAEDVLFPHEDCPSGRGCPGVWCHLHPHRFPSLSSLVWPQCCGHKVGQDLLRPFPAWIIHQSMTSSILSMTSSILPMTSSILQHSAAVRQILYHIPMHKEEKKEGIQKVLTQWVSVLGKDLLFQLIRDEEGSGFTQKFICSEWKQGIQMWKINHQKHQVLLL